MTDLDDDELTRLLINARPIRTPRDAPLDEAAIRMRDRIVRGETAPLTAARRGPSTRFVFVTLASAAVAGALVVTALVHPAGQAEAVTPRPLAFTVDGTADDLLDGAVAALEADDGPGHASRTVRSVSWSLANDVDEQRIAVQPQFSVFTWHEDLSGHLRVIGGEPYWPSAQTGSAEAVPGGEVILDMDIEPGQYSTPVVDVPGDSRTDVHALLTAFGLPASPTGADVVEATVSVLDQWTLSDAQHVVILDLLRATGDAVALGRTTDRVGRSVDALEVPTAGGGHETVLISAETGRIVGVETVQGAADGIVPRGAVITYSLWDLTDGSSR